MIYFDVTKTGGARHHSGLTRVGRRLHAELAQQTRCVAVKWRKSVGLVTDSTERGTREKAVSLQPDDWFLTTELFSADERPGFAEFLATRRCRLAAVFHDAIPLKLPHLTWPQSVARHPGYLKLLSRFDRIWAVSRASREELLGFWRWQGVAHPPPVDVLALGADFDRLPRGRSHRVVRPAGLRPSRPSLLCLGIVEPRKNQSLLLEVCEDLWAGGAEFELHLVGRINPHFGAPIVARLKALQRRRAPLLHFHAAATDDQVAHLYARARASVFPTLAEGCGLPLLESLWRGVPCVCSDLPVLRENADGGGCLPVASNEPAAWRAALQRILIDDALHGRLVAAAAARTLPTWTETAHALAQRLG